ncbi:uncharacterized protein LOC128205104 isoform X2 [Mya arenaria]|uniref:uncharacterized protein LOC128205104 isoform X2 n=1 Tax=Mya arenaria TaxID=6604 RepID=UPI0022E45D2B|nr:uncharacterized protein LOC128205104 isoform X2 [Mya arenaria]
MEGAIENNDSGTSLEFLKSQCGGESAKAFHYHMRDSIDKLPQQLLLSFNKVNQMVTKSLKMVNKSLKILEARLLHVEVKFKNTPKENNTEMLEQTQHAMSPKGDDSNTAISDQSKYECVCDSVSTSFNGETLRQETLCLNASPVATTLKGQSIDRHGRNSGEEKQRLKKLFGAWKCSQLPLKQLVLLLTMFSLPGLSCAGHIDQTAAVGMRASIECDINEILNLRSSPRTNSTVENGTVTWADAGSYICKETKQASVNLEVTFLTPLFQKDRLSYISFPLEKTQSLMIQLSFKPFSTDGLVLYIANATDERPSATFALEGGYAMLRLYKGSAFTMIKGKQLLTVDESHTIYFSFDRSEATMGLDQYQPEVIPLPKDLYQGIGGRVYIGASLYLTTMDKSKGFEGIVSEFRLNNRLVDMGTEAQDIVGIVNYNACSENACENSSVCIPTNTKEGYVCICLDNHTENIGCQLARKSCSFHYPDTITEDIVITWKSTDGHITYVNVNNTNVADCTPLHGNAELNYINNTWYNASFRNGSCELSISHHLLSSGRMSVEVESSTGGLNHVFVNDNQVHCMTSAMALIYIQGGKGDSSNDLETQHPYNPLVTLIIMGMLVSMAASAMAIWKRRSIIRYFLRERRESNDGDNDGINGNRATDHLQQEHMDDED